MTVILCLYSDGEVEDGTAADDESDERLEKRKTKVRAELWPSLSNHSNFVQVCVAFLSVIVFNAFPLGYAFMHSSP